MDINRFYSILDKTKLKKEVVKNDSREIANYSLPGDVVTRISIIDAPLIYPDGLIDNWVYFKVDGFSSEFKKISSLTEEDLNSIIEDLLSREVIDEERYHELAKKYFNKFIEALRSYENVNTTIEETEEINEYSKKGNLLKSIPAKILLKIGDYVIIEINKDYETTHGKFIKYTYEKDYGDEHNLIPYPKTDSYLGTNDVNSLINKMVNTFLNGRNTN